MSAFLLLYAAAAGIAIALDPRLYRAFLLLSWGALILSIALEFSTP